MDVLKEVAKKEFVFNGNTYYVSESLSLRRMMYYELAMYELMTSYSDNYISQLLNMKAYLEKSDFFNSAVLLNNMIMGYNDKMNLQRIHPAIKVCACFLNRKGEDLGLLTEEMLRDKSEDFMNESEKEVTPYKADFFLKLANASREDFQK